MSTWFTDTLAKRLFVLMWLALVASHIAAWLAVRTVFPPPGAGQAGAAPGMRMPTFPSLPPTPGVPQVNMPGGPGGPGARDGRPPPEPGQHSPAPRPGGPPGGPAGSPAGAHLPTNALVLDYGIRLVVIALAAWLGSRWVSRPMRKLAQASHALGASVGGEAALPELDERAGTVEVREAASVFNAMARKLREQFQGRGLMVAAISHDLRTPLTRLRMRLEEMTAEEGARQRCINDIREMNGLIDTVLDVFQDEGAQAGAPGQNTDVTALVQALVDDLAEQGQPVTFSGEPAVTHAQPAALRRVVDNLVSNALRYGASAQVSVTADARQVVIAVEDRGPGIDPAFLQAVFRPFFRIESSRNRATGGAGLGLYIARDLARRQGGELVLANRPEGGLRAEVVLPRR